MRVFRGAPDYSAIPKKVMRPDFYLEAMKGWASRSTSLKSRRLPSSTACSTARTGEMRVSNPHHDKEAAAVLRFEVPGYLGSCSVRGSGFRVRFEGFEPRTDRPGRTPEPNPESEHRTEHEPKNGELRTLNIILAKRLLHFFLPSAALRWP